MSVPVQVTFRHMEPSDAVEQQIRERAADLERFYPRIIACHAVVDEDHRRHRHGKLFHISIDITVPGREIAVGREPAAHHAHEDCHVAIRDAFDAARRQLEDHVRRARGDVKAHEAAQMGRISSIISDQGYAFLVTDSGDEIYVHRNSVVDGGFDHLRVGHRVRFVLSPEPGDKGPQASTGVPLPE